LPEYSHDTILRALHYKPKKIDFVLTIIGDGKQTTYLRALAKKLKIEDKVIFYRAYFK
jgi:glycosyltransferase involved in cell wall biosynthesis